jgi:hypothetical protein
MYCLCVNVYCHRVTTQLQLINISYHIISYHITSHHIIYTSDSKQPNGINLLAASNSRMLQRSNAGCSTSRCRTDCGWLGTAAVASIFRVQQFNLTLQMEAMFSFPRNIGNVPINTADRHRCQQFCDKSNARHTLLAVAGRLHHHR